MKTILKCFVCFASIFFLVYQSVLSVMAQTDSAQSKAMTEKDSATNSVEGYFKTVTDEKSGHYAIVNTNKEEVILKDNRSKKIWSTNVVAGLKNTPKLTGRKIKGLRMHKGELWVDLTRGYAIIDPKTGQLTGWATN